MDTAANTIKRVNTEENVHFSYVCDLVFLKAVFGSHEVKRMSALKSGSIGVLVKLL